MSVKKSNPAQKKNGISVSNSVDLDTQQPIPLEGGAMFSAFNTTEYLPFLAPLDTFAQVLLEARLLSATHSACIETKSDFCAGEGMMDREGRELDSRIIEWFDSINVKDETVGDINKQIFESHFQFGNTPIEVVRYKSELSGNKIFVYVHNFLEWRLCPPNEDGICTHAIQSKHFIRNRNTGLLTKEDLESARTLPIYNPRIKESKRWLPDGKGTERTIIWYKNNVSGYPNYGMPSSVASLIYQVLEYKGARFNLDDFENGMVISAILALKGTHTADEVLKVSKSIINTHVGDGKRARVAVIASEQGIEGSEFHQLDTKKDGSYNESDDKWSQKIIFSNKWDAILAGLVSPSTLGKGEGFITKLFEIKQNQVQRPAQQHLLRNVWLNIFDIAREWMSLPFERYNIGIRNSLNIGAIMDVDLTPAVTVDEVRLANGHPALEDKEKGKMLMGEIKGSQQKAKKEVENVPPE